jgi:epoxyqueuosine reductase QueG
MSMDARYKILGKKAMKDKFIDWVFGCDICQDICP